MTREQSECSALLKLGDDGVWFCPECGLRISLPAPRRGRRAKRPEVTQNAVQDSRPELESRACADRSGPYSNPID
jgi:hypothetical protein